jgi:hypothetical protein
MKKTILFSFLVLFVVMLSCSKDQRLSRKLDGEWLMTTYYDEPVVAPERGILTLIKGKRGTGEGSFSYTQPVNVGGTIETQTYTDKITYTIRDDRMTISPVGSLFSTSYGFLQDAFTIQEATKTRLVLVDSNNEICVFEKN